MSTLLLSRVMLRYRGVVGRRAPRRGAWVLLETVIATGLLILGLSVIGTQVQDASSSIRKMQLRLRAMMLAERKLAELDLGLVELDSIDEVEEEEFGPRYPDFGWRLITDETGLEEMFLLTLEILYLPQDSEHYGDYQEGDFDFDNAETLFTIRALRKTPEPLDLAAFGGRSEEAGDSEDEPSEYECDCLEGLQLDLACFVGLELEDLVKCIGAYADATGLDVSALFASLPPEISDMFGDDDPLSSLFDEGEDEGEEGR